MDVLPDIQLGPVGEWEDADALTLLDLGVVKVPQFRSLTLRFPPVAGGAERENPLLGTRFLLVAARPAEGRSYNFV